MATVAVLSPSTTPPDYFRIVSPTLKVPSEKSTSIPVGLLAAQRDPLLREIETTVVACNISQPSPAPVGKKTKKAVSAPTLPNEPILEVILHDTVIFPEGGGQPTDTGLIKTSDGRIWSVLQAKRHGGHAVHYVKTGSEADVQSALTVFAAGSIVTASLGKEDFDRRYDHMSMHTSQHLLSALLETRLNLPTLSWSLTSFPSPCYVEVPRGMTVEEIVLIQTEANRLVFEGRRVHTEVEELDRDKNGRSVGKALPSDYTGGVNRVVVIDGVDRNPCCGTHLPSIHNLQLFLLPHTDSMSRSNTTSARLYFLSGPRLIDYLSSTHNFLANTSSILSCGAPLVPERVSQVVEERKKADKRVTDLELELAKHISTALISEAAVGSGNDGYIFKKHVHRTDDGGNPLGFLSAISFAFSDQIANTPYLLILTSTPSAQTTTSTTVVMVVGSDDNLVKSTGEALKSQMAVKGGGKGLKWSGKYNGVWKFGNAVDTLLKSIE
ncbi:alanyl-tRNA synthetase domain-containing protein [Gymnopus androsaceus JB14]|uniref:Alanyl-tRNA synthetase domain-containing protein n=1 Tax=Gymnopus androsaceus JB14 TaxID=1447944 RepID=A0A6A4IIN4_9AGAR|nr:alanyl-tRNA synthetase domain-containing protein [Gymnopus androsaceus JB14]